MQFVNEFDVEAPLDEVWDAILDVERVAPTVPGASVTERTSDTAYKVAIKVKVGPMSMTYKGDVEIVERDDAAHRAVMKARAKESRGQGTADADVTMVLTGADGRTSARVTTDVDLSGKVATMGQGVLQDVSGRLIGTFAKNLATMLESSGAAPAASDAAPAPGLVAASAPPPPPPTGDQDTDRAGRFEHDAPTPPPPPRPQFEGEDALDLGSVGGAVAAEQLRDPRKLGGLIGLVALLAYLLGRRAGARS